MMMLYSHSAPSKTAAGILVRDIYLLVPLQGFLFVIFAVSIYSFSLTSEFFLPSIQFLSHNPLYLCFSAPRFVQFLRHTHLGQVSDPRYCAAAAHPSQRRLQISVSESLRAAALKGLRFSIAYWNRRANLPLMLPIYMCHRFLRSFFPAWQLFSYSLLISGISTRRRF